MSKLGVFCGQRLQGRSPRALPGQHSAVAVRLAMLGLRERKGNREPPGQRGWVNPSNPEALGWGALTAECV